MRDVAELVAFLVGLALIVAGVYAIWPPAAPILAGLVLSGAALSSAKARS